MMAGNRAVSHVLVILTMLLAACAQLEPYHTQAGDPVPNCPPDESGHVPDACRQLIVERFAGSGAHDPGYSLYFAEFDDQGWPYESRNYGAAGRQVQIFTREIEAEL